MLNKEKLEVYDINYFQNYIPVEYKLRKGEILNINPILVKDYLIYSNCSEILSIDKDRINDINVMQMSYLQFLYEKIINNNVDSFAKEKLSWICWKIFGYENYLFDYDKERITLCLIGKNDKNENVYDKIITPKEFDEIIQIIFSQNDKTYDNRHYSEDVKELIKKYRAKILKTQKIPTLEERLNFVSSKLGKFSNELRELTFREFQGIYDSCLDSEIFLSRKIIQASYKYKVDDFQHPLFEPKKDITDEIFGGTTESFISKLNK